MRVEIRQLHKRLGATTIYVTHDQIEALTMADKIVLMKDGGIVQVGSPDDLYDRPNSRHVAEFIGSPQINCQDGKIYNNEGIVRFKTPGLTIDLPEGFARYTDQKVTCGIRPNDVTLDPNGTIIGNLRIAEKTGADKQMHLDVNGVEFVAVTPRDAPGKAGDVLNLSVDPAKVHIFDHQSGNRLSA